MIVAKYEVFDRDGSVVQVGDVVRVYAGPADAPDFVLYRDELRPSPTLLDGWRLTVSPPDSAGGGQ